MEKIQKRVSEEDSSLNDEEDYLLDVEPTDLDDILWKLENLENELILLNEKVGKKQFVVGEWLLFFILLILLFNN